MSRKMLLVVLVGFPVYLNFATFFWRSKTIAYEDIGFCSVPFTRDCNTTNVENPCDGDCAGKDFGDVCGYDTLLFDDETFEWILPALAGKDNVDTNFPQVKCGMVFECQCDINLLCKHTLFGGQDWMQSQMTSDGDNCP